MPDTLNWTVVTWERFQKLCIYLAQEQYKDLKFQEHLKMGNGQDGIDIFSTVRAPKYITLQCKHEKLTITKLDKIFDEFKEGEFFGKSSRFILATTSDLQNKKIHDHLENKKKEFLQYDIRIECWDCTHLSDQLKSFYTLVAYFFNQETANSHCFLQAKPTVSHFAPLPNYIPRRIIPFDENAEKNTYRWYLRKDESLELIDMFSRENMATSAKMCILGDPYQGKSSLLKQTAYLLTQLKSPFVPIFLDMKDHVIRPIEDILNLQAGAWRSTPIFDLVVFVDGLDEVPTDKFDETIMRIKEFSAAFPALPIVLSCRTLFYAHYSIKEKLSDFKCFELFDLSRGEIDTHAKGILHKSYDHFMEKVRELDLEKLLYDPFYLSEIINSYKEPPHELPRSKAEVLEKFIVRSIQKSGLRKLRKGSDFKHKMALYQLTIQKFAFGLQLLGLNSIEEGFLQRLFNEDELEVLQHSPLLKVEQNKWSFLSALFQEYLAARVLVRLPFETVSPIVTVGQLFVKVKAKWLQTFTTLLALLEKGDLRNKYIALLEKDNIELLFETDRSKFDEDLRSEILSKMLSQCARKNMRPTIVYESKIGTFVGSDQKSIDLLLSKLALSSSGESLKVLCCDILEYAKLGSAAIDRLVSICSKEINKTKAVMVASRCLKLLTAYRHFSEQEATKLVSQVAHSEHHIFRKEVYRYLRGAGLVDRFFDYGIEGMPILIQYNRGIHNVGSEHFLLTFFQSTRCRHNLQKLFKKLTEKDWVEFFRYNTERRSFIDGLVTAGIEIYQNSPEIVFDFIEYIKNLEKRALLTETNGLDHFFTQTDSNRVAVGILFPDMLSVKGVDYGAFLSRDTLPYFLFELEEGNYRADRLWRCVYSLQQAQKMNLAEELNNIAHELSLLEGSEEEGKELRRWEDFERIKRRNDIKYYLSTESFKKALKSFFRFHGKKEVTTDETYIDVTASDELKKIASYFLDYLMKGCAQNKKVSLKSCLNFVNKHDSFAYFKANEAIGIMNDKDSPEIIQFLESYYNELITSANFENCWYQSGGEIRYKRREEMISRLFKKYRFETPVEILIKMIWLDNGSARININDEDKKNPSVTKLIIERIAAADINRFKDQILANLQLGISDHSVFGRHATLCHHYGIVEARNIIQQRIMAKEVEKFDTTYLCKYYIELGGEPENIKIALEDSMSDEYIFIELADLLIEYLPEYVKEMLLRYLTATDVADKKKAKAAVRLCKMGEMEGFRFWVNCIKKDGISPIDIQGPFTISKLDTSLVLEEVGDIAHHILDEERGAFHNTARRIILEWMFTLAAKGEKDLKLVVDFLNKLRTRLKANLRVDYLHWYIDQCVEKFRENGVTNIDINGVRMQLNALPEEQLYF